MKVRELINQLRMYDADTLVVLSRDEEGNGYRPLCAVLDNAIFIDHRWEGEVKIAVMTEKLRKQGYTDDDVYHAETDGKGVPAVVLYPS